MIAVLAENHLAYRGKLKDMCEFLGVATSTYNRDKIKEAIEALSKKGDILVLQQGQTWTLTLSTTAERKQRVIKIRNAWIRLIQQYEAVKKEDYIAWENILKVLVYLIADKAEVKTYNDIAEALNISTKTVERAITALDGIEFNDLSIKRKLAWFKNTKGEFRIKGQKIDVGYNFN